MPITSPILRPLPSLARSDTTDEKLTVLSAGGAGPSTQHCIICRTIQSRNISTSQSLRQSFLLIDTCCTTASRMGTEENSLITKCFKVKKRNSEYLLQLRGQNAILKSCFSCWIWRQYSSFIDKICLHNTRGLEFPWLLPLVTTLWAICSMYVGAVLVGILWKVCAGKCQLVEITV